MMDFLKLVILNNTMHSSGVSVCSGSIPRVNNSTHRSEYKKSNFRTTT